MSASLLSKPIVLARLLFVLIATLLGGLVALDTSGDPFVFTLSGLVFGLAFVVFEYSTKAVSSRRIVLGTLGWIVGLVCAQLFYPTFGWLAGLLVRGVNAIRQFLSPHDALFDSSVAARRAEMARNLVTPEMAKIVCQVLFGYLGLVTALRHADWFRLGNLRLYMANPLDRPRVLDTSVVVDGRVAEVIRIGLITGPVVVPQFVLREIQALADSHEEHRRARGRRGLDVLDGLRTECKSFDVVDTDYPDLAGTDDKLVRLCRETNADLVTNDSNLQKIAEVQQIRTLNLNRLANAMRPAVYVGEVLHDLKIVKAGKEPGQGVGFLDDGTMLVVEGAERLVGREVSVVVGTILQNPAGRLVFAKPVERESRERG